LTLAAAGCGHSSSSPATDRLGARTAPDLAAFLRQPVATPTACPAGQQGSASGRRSPWAGHVDISVFLTSGAPPRTVTGLGSRLRRSRLVEKVYYESQAQAYAEFQRLYTCWSAVPRSQTPASYRLLLIPTVTFGQRNDLVAKVLRMPGVDTVSCDPSVPCVNVVNSASAAPG
jgi:hypothetical protein